MEDHVMDNEKNGNSTREGKPLFEPAASVEQPKKGGCMKKILIGCGVLLIVGIVVVIAAVAFVLKNKDKMISWSVGKLEKVVMAEVTDEGLRQDLKMNFSGFSEALKEGRISEADAQNLIMALSESVQDGRVTEEEVARINSVFDDILDKTSSAPEEQPSEEEIYGEEPFVEEPGAPVGEDTAPEPGLVEI